MNDRLHELMREATHLTQAGRLAEATQVIQRALQGANAMPPASTRAAAPAADVIDGCVFDVTAAAPADAISLAPSARFEHQPAEPGPGEFLAGSFSHASQTLAYKLFVPASARGGQAMPLVVMLHGCTQDPDDFAAGTAMNECAREQGFLVLYPAQSRSANPQGCWNWFKHTHQQRGRGEPALIAALTRQIMQTHAVDARRVYIAGLSAGGAMAAIVAEAYPELFAAVGVHSGLPNGAASNVSEALAAMQSGSAAAPSSTPRRVAREKAERVVPTIVFHGDHDNTVHHRNGEQVIDAVIARAQAHQPNRTARAAQGAVRVERGASAQGRHYTRSLHHGARGEVLAEHWLVHGAAHAWQGGRAEGSYTDAQGPDATREMLRFFFAHPHEALDAHQPAPTDGV